jgi:hypothetical protein
MLRSCPGRQFAPGVCRSGDPGDSIALFMRTGDYIRFLGRHGEIAVRPR